MQCVQSVGNGFIRSANRVHYTECMNAFPTRGGKRFGYDEAWALPPSLREVAEGRRECPTSVGNGLLYGRHPLSRFATAETVV